MINSFVIQVFGRDDDLDDALLQGPAHALQGNALIVLHRDHDGVNTHGDHGPVLLDVLDCHLGDTGTEGTSNRAAVNVLVASVKCHPGYPKKCREMSVLTLE